MPALPDKNVVGKVKIDKKIMQTDDWQAAKEMADFTAADRIVDRLWSDKKTEQLKGLVDDPANVAFITQPSSSGMNVLPIQLAKRLSKEFFTSYLVGDEFFSAGHVQQSKHIPRLQRPFNRREYVSHDINSLKQHISGKTSVVVEDVLTTGGSVAEFTRTLTDAGIHVKSVVGLMGDRRLNMDAKTLDRLDQALKAKEIPVSAKKLSKILTRAEAGGMIMLINSGRSENAKQKLTENLQRLLHRGPFKDLGRDQAPGRYKSTEGKDYHHEKLSERVSPWSVRNSEKTATIKPEHIHQIHYQISVRDKSSGKTYIHEVSAARPFENKQELKQFLKEEAHSFVRRIGPVRDIKDLDVTVRPLESKELQAVKEMGKEGLSR